MSDEQQRVEINGERLVIVEWRSPTASHVQYIGVVSFNDDEGSSIRAFSDARILQVLYKVPPGEDGLSTFECLEGILGESPQDTFQILLTERSVKPKLLIDSLVRFNVEFAFVSGDLTPSPEI